jgi:hypothetical protein
MNSYAKNLLFPRGKAVYANDEQRIKLGLPVVPKQTRVCLPSHMASSINSTALIMMMMMMMVVM